VTLRSAVALAAAVALLSGIATAQTQGVQAQDAAETPRTDGPRDGWRIFNASAYTGFQSLDMPGVSGSATLVPIGSDMLSGGAASVGWRRSRPDSNLMLVYSPSYSAMMRHSEWNALNHSAAFHVGRRAGQKWNTTFSASASLNNLNSFLFTPSGLSNVVSAPGSSQDLSSAVLTGRYGNTQLESALSGGTVLDSAARTALYGNRVLSASGSAGLTYNRSTRFSLTFGATGSRTQGLHDNQASGQYRGLLQRTTAVNGNVGVSYAFSPRTQFGLEASVGRTLSDFMDGYTSRVMVTLGRTIGMHWFLQGGAGAAYTSSAGTLYRVPNEAQPTGRGSIGYRLRSQSLMATFDHTPSASYGTGAGYTESVGGAWRWHRPGGGWETSASLRQQRMRGGSLQDLDGWIASYSVLKSLSRQTAAQIGYSYMYNSGMYVGAARTITVHAVEFTVLWRDEPPR